MLFAIKSLLHNIAAHLLTKLLRLQKVVLPNQAMRILCLLELSFESRTTLLTCQQHSILVDLQSSKELGA